MAFWTFTIAALNAADVATTLYFSNNAYIDGSANYYQIRLLQPSLINILANDGGVLSMFGQSSIGEVELANADGSLDILADYAVDGRVATLSLIDNGTTTIYFTGTVGRMQSRGNSLFFALKALPESLTTNHPLGAAYLGDNVLPAGLEGTTDDIEGNVKPRVYGDCRNIAAVSVNTSNLIYQVSSKTDCVITAVYDNGVRLTNYLVNHAGGYAIGATSIAVDTGTGAIPINAQVMFKGHQSIYTVTTALTAGSMVISPGLTAAIADNAPVEVVNFFTGTGSSAGQLQGATLPAVWGSRQGYFRLVTSPAGVVTCDAMSVTSLALHQAGDVLAALAAEVTTFAITVDATSKTAFNTAGVIGIYVDAEVSTLELFNRVARSVIGYYWFVASTLYFNLLNTPAAAADLTIEDWMIIEISRDATGIGSNGVPISGVKMAYDRIETVQTATAGSLYGTAWGERLKKQIRVSEAIDTAAQTRYKLSEKIEINGVLRAKGDVSTAINRLKNLGKVRRDVVSILCARKMLPAFSIGQTALVKKSRLGYDAGRKMVIIGYELDAKKDVVTLRCYG